MFFYVLIFLVHVYCGYLRDVYYAFIRSCNVCHPVGRRFRAEKRKWARQHKINLWDLYPQVLLMVTDLADFLLLPGNFLRNLVDRYGKEDVGLNGFLA